MAGGSPLRRMRRFLGRARQILNTWPRAANHVRVENFLKRRCAGTSTTASLACCLASASIASCRRFSATTRRACEEGTERKERKERKERQALRADGRSEQLGGKRGAKGR